jgi:hypothetical protein
MGEAMTVESIIMVLTGLSIPLFSCSSVHLTPPIYPLCQEGPYPHIIADQENLMGIPQDQYILCSARQLPLIFSCGFGNIFDVVTQGCIPHITPYDPHRHLFPPHTKPYIPAVEGEPEKPDKETHPVNDDSADDLPVQRPYPVDIPILKPVPSYDSPPIQYPEDSFFPPVHHRPYPVPYPVQRIPLRNLYPVGSERPAMVNPVIKPVGSEGPHDAQVPFRPKPIKN